MPKYKRVDSLGKPKVKKYKPVSTKKKYKKPIVKRPNLAGKVLKAPKRINQYKSVNSYINAVYRSNKDIIAGRINKAYVELHGSENKAFNALVKERMAMINLKTGENYTVKEAIQAVNNSMALMADFDDRGLKGTELLAAKQSYIRAVNFEKAIKRDRKVWAKVVNVGGRFTQFNPNELQFLGYYKDEFGSFAAYQYGDKIIIERQSPKRDKNGNEVGASIDVMSKKDFDNKLNSNDITQDQKERRKYSYHG